MMFTTICSNLSTCGETILVFFRGVKPGETVWAYYNWSYDIMALSTDGKFCDMIVGTWLFLYWSTAYQNGHHRQKWRQLWHYFNKSLG